MQHWTLPMGDPSLEILQLDQVRDHRALLTTSSYDTMLNHGIDSKIHQHI